MTDIDQEAQVNEEPVIQDVVTNDSLLVIVSTGLPISLGEIKALIPAGWPEQPYLADIESFGFALVKPTEPPVGDVVMQAVPALVDGVWTQSWAVRSFNAEELAANLQTKKDRLSIDVMAIRDNDFSTGLAYSVEEGKTFHIQLRDQDRSNLLALNIEASNYLAAGQESTFKFRGLENFTVVLTAAQTVEMTRAALSAINAIYDASWDIKDRILAATVIEDLPVVPMSLIPA